MIGVSRSAEMCSSLCEGLQAQILCGSDSNPLRGCHEKQVLRGWILAKWKRTLYNATFARLQKKASLNSAPLKFCFWTTSPPSTINCLQQEDNYYWTLLLRATLKLSCTVLFFSEDCDIFVQQKLISPVYLFNACPSCFGHSFIHIYNCIYLNIIYILYI